MRSASPLRRPVRLLCRARLVHGLLAVPLVVALVVALGLGGAASAAAGGSLSDLQSGLASCSGTPGTPYAVVLSADLSDSTAALTVNCDARIDLHGHDLTVGHVVIASSRSLEVTDTTPAASGPDPDANAGTLTADSGDASGHAGIQTTGATLITSGTAQVVATGGAFSAGIGGTYDKAAGGTTTSKDSSTITAFGGRYGAGIGGSDLGAGGTTTSNDFSTITATGGDYGAGIGGGDNGAGGTTTSNDSSTITATGGYAGPGIGGGLDATDAGITRIQGGSTIDAKGGTGGSDIGLVGDDVTPSSGTFLAITNGTLLLENHLVVLDDGHPSADVVIEGEGRITQSPGALISGSGLIENRGAIRIPTAQVDPTKVSVHHYLVSFDTNGGSAAPAAVTVFADTFTHGDRTLPAAPTKVGATFTGWNTAADGSGDNIDADAVLPGASSDGSAHPVTLYAQYDEATTPVLTVTASSPSITAGSAIPAITPSYSGFVNGDDASVVTTAPTCSTTATTSSPVGDYPTTCTGGTVNGYTFNYVAGTLHITAAPVLTVTASSPAMVYGGAVPVVTPSYSGFAPGDDAAVVTTAPTCSTTATSSSAAGNYPTTCTGGTAPGYTLSYVAGSLQVAAAPLSVTAPSPSVTHGSAIPAITPSYSGFVNGDGASAVTTAPTCSTTATSSSPAGSYPTSCAGGAATNYSLTYTDGSLHITAATLTVTASSPAMVYGGAVPVVTPSYSGFAPGDDAAVVTTAPTCSTTATSSSPAGNYPTTCTGGTAAGYTLSYVAGSVQVAAAPLSVTASSPAMVYGSTPPLITPSYSGFVNGDDASVVTTAPTCSTTATSSSPVGSYPTSCAGGAAANYTLTHADGSLQVAAAPLVVTASSGSMVYGSTPPPITPSYSGFVNGDDTSLVSDLPTCSTTATSSSPVGSYPTSCAGGAAPNYTLTHADGTLQVTPATITGLAPSITGRAQVRQVLSAHPGPVDPTTVALTYLWRADGVAIPGAVSSTLRLTRDLAGARIRVRITATYPGRDPAVATSAASPYVREFVKRARVGLDLPTVCPGSGTVKGLGQGLVPGNTYTIHYLRTTIRRTADEYGEVHFPVTIPAGTNSGPHVETSLGLRGKKPKTAVGAVLKLDCVH